MTIAANDIMCDIYAEYMRVGYTYGIPNGEFRQVVDAFLKAARLDESMENAVTAANMVTSALLSAEWAPVLN